MHYQVIVSPNVPTLHYSLELHFEFSKNSEVVSQLMHSLKDGPLHSPPLLLIKIIKNFLITFEVLDIEII